MFIDFSTLLSSIGGFLDANEALENQGLTRTLPLEKFVLLFVSFLWRLKLLGYVLNSHICD